MIDQLSELLAYFRDELSVRWTITLLHFLWQGVVLGVVALGLEPMLRQASASLRYRAYVGLLFCLPLLVVATLTMVEPPTTMHAVAVDNSVSLGSPIALNANSHRTEESPAPIERADGQVAAESIGRFAVDVPVANALASGPQSSSNAVTTSDRIRQATPWITIAYLIGVAFFTLRVAMALCGGLRLRTRSRLVTEPRLLEIMRVQTRRIGLSVVPALAYSERVAVPTVVGLVRPMVLIPASLASGLTTAEISAVLSHELSHIHRYDLWVNLIQRIIESFLFFHPVVWFLSRRLSAERELCCDDLVLRCGHGSMAYAGALISMTELCVASRPTPIASLTASGRNFAELEHRIQRLMGIKQKGRLRLTPTGAMLFAILLLSVVTGPVMLTAFAQSPAEEQEPSSESAGEDERGLPEIFRPAPRWQIRLDDNEADDDFAIGSTTTVAGNRVMVAGRQFIIETAQDVTPVEERASGAPESKTIFRRLSSDRLYIVEVSIQRAPPNVLMPPSHTIRVIRAADGSQVGRSIQRMGAFGHGSDVEVESRGNFILVGDRSGVHVFRIETGEVETTLPVEIKRVDAVAFSPDHEWLVVSDRNDLHFWRWRDQAEVKTIHAGRKIDSLKFTPDGQYLAEGPDSRVDIQIRDMRTFKIIASLTDEVNSPLMVSSIDISPDGRFLVAHNQVTVDPERLTIPNRIHLWELRSRRPVFQISTNEWVRRVAFSDDGKAIIAKTTGATHGGVLAAWKIPSDVLAHDSRSPQDAVDRLGDSIEWSKWGDRDGLLSGARLIRPQRPLRVGDPLVVEYRLANVSLETKSIDVYVNDGIQLPSLATGNLISGVRLKRNQKTIPLTLEPGEVFIDTDHLVHVDTHGLSPGRYDVSLGSAFFFAHESNPNVTHSIPHRGRIPVELVGEKKANLLEMPPSDIQWGRAVAGLRLGARWRKPEAAYSVGTTLVADLFIANSTDRTVEFVVELPHPGDGWLFNIDTSIGSVVLERPTPFSAFTIPSYILLKLDPREVFSITGAPVRTSHNRRPSEEELSERSIAPPKFEIVATQEQAKQPWANREMRGRLVSRGGDFTAVFGVTVMRDDLPQFRIHLETSDIPFVVAKHTNGTSEDIDR